MFKNADYYRDLFEPFLLSPVADSNGDYDAFCPAHENPDTSQKPSAKLNFSPRAKRRYPGGMWFCFVCVPSGDECSMENLEQIYQRRLDQGLRHSSKRRNAGTWKPKANKAETSAIKRLWEPDEYRVFEEALDDAKHRDFLNSRGLTLATAHTWGIGWVNGIGRYSIPVTDGNGQVVNYRLYKPNATSDKMIWRMKGRDRTRRLFGIEHLPSPCSWVVLLEGEFDTILCSQDGFPAITQTQGAKFFQAEYLKHFQDRVVFICYDNDDGGREGRNVALEKLRGVAEAVYFIDLPGEGTDYTDFRVKLGKSAKDFQALIDAAKADQPIYQKALGSAPARHGRPVNIAASYDAGLNGETVEMEVQVVGRSDPPYSIPKTIEYTCLQDKGNSCEACPMNTMYDGSHTTNVEENSDIIRKLIDQPEKHRTTILRNIIGARCSDRLQIDEVDSYSIENLVIEETIEAKKANEQSDADYGTVRSVYNHGHDTKTNTQVRLVGTQRADPRNGRGMFLSWDIERTKTSLDKFAVTPEITNMLEIFKPAKGQSPLEKCEEIARDLAANVTNIIGRTDLHIGFDLVWHSVLRLPLLESVLEKGWLDVICMGDSRTGKTEIAKRLSDHYNAGMLYACDQASLAGLVGGVTQPTGKHWQVKWGALPLHDMRLVVLDESQSLLDKGIIDNMSSIRSSGIAEITKIETSQTTARTRLLWIANPPSGSNIAAMAGKAMDGIRDMFSAHEDIARFDFAMAAARDDVSSKDINTTEHEEVDHKYTKEACSALVLWAWTRKPEDIVWAEGAENLLLKESIKLGNMYSPTFPLIQGENVRVKLARIAAAIAARTFSSDEDGARLIITRSHVRSAVEFLHMCYDSETFGYGRMSRRIAKNNKEAHSNVDVAREYLTGERTLPDGNGPIIAKGMLAVGGNFEPKFLADAAGMSLMEILAGTRYLTDLKLIRRTHGGRICEVHPELTNLLRQLEDEEDL